MGGFGTTSYRYGGLKAEGGEAGRGSLGFAWQEVKNNDTNSTIRTDFNQTYPFIGRPSKVGNQVFSQSQAAYTFTYDNMKAHGASTSQALRGGAIAGMQSYGGTAAIAANALQTYYQTGSASEALKTVAFSYAFSAASNAFATGGVLSVLGQSISGYWGRVVGGAVNGYIQTGTLNGAARGAIAAGIVPDDLGMTQAYNNNPMANIAIGIARDGIRGYMVGGREGIVDGIN